MTDSGEHERMPPGGTRRYWWLEFPWWARGALAGPAFGAVMFGVSWANDDDSDPTGQIIGAAVSAVLFAVAMADPA